MHVSRNRSATTLRLLRASFVPGLLFISGATSLVYELVWSKHLANLLGNSGQAHSIVLATFMGGLALGAYVFGRSADRVKSPLFLYGVLELGIALYAMAFDTVLGGLGAAFLKLAPGLDENARVVAKLALASTSLLIPTMLMGGTLPAMVRHFAKTLASVRKELSKLYAINSVGAAFGVFFAGVVLVPRAGLAASAALAILFNLAVAAVAMGVARAAQRRPAEMEASAPSAERETVYPAAAVKAALFGVMVSGFTSMLYEVLWIRLLSIVMGGSTYAFTLILTAFILGIGLGSFWLTRRRETSDALALFGKLQIGLVVAVAIALPLYVRLPHFFYVAQYGLHRSPMTWPLYQGLVFVFCSAVLLLPTFFMGAAFPTAARVATSRVAELGRQLGGVYLYNTLGTILGAAAGGLWLMPALGMEGSFALGIAFNVAAAVWALWVSSGGKRLRSLAPMAVGLVAALTLVSSWGWSRYVANGAMFRDRGAPFASFEAQRQVVEADKVLFHDDDTFATVLVAAHKGGSHKFMKINGKVDASNGADIDTQILAGHFGVLFHPREVKNVLLIGAGAAVTAGSLLTHPIERLDLVEISPAVIEGARLFGEDNRHALDDPRTHVHIEDAKTFMALSQTKYDLVVSVPSNPWVAGVSGLFTQDFFRHVSAHMAEDGILVQWIHTYDSSEPLVKLVLRTLRDTFPDATTWLGPHDLAMVASKRPLTFDFEVIAQRMARPEAAEDLARCEVRDVFTLLGKQVHSPARQAEFAGEGPLNTDDHNQLEYASAQAFYLRADYVPVRDSRRSPEEDPGLLLHRYLGDRVPSAQELANLFRQVSKYHAVNDPLVRSVAERWHSVAPADPDAAFALGRLALEQKDFAVADGLLTPFAQRVEATPEQLAAYLRLVTERVWAQRSIFNPVDLRLARQTFLRLQQARGEPKIATVLENYCRAVPKKACETDPGAFARPADP